MNTPATHNLGLHILTDREYSKGRDTITVVKAALEGGATVIQLRDKIGSTRSLIEQGLAIRTLTRRYGALFIVNDRVDVALAVNADGVHVGQDDMPPHLARILLGNDRILGVSAGNLEEAQAAIAGGADYLGVGPIFSTATKADAGEAVGLDLLRTLSQPAYNPQRIPLVAIGGLKISNTPDTLRAGANGIAVISAVVSADDITAATRALRTQVDHYSKHK